MPAAEHAEHVGRPPYGVYLDSRFKGFPASAAPLQASAIAERGWNVLAGDLPLPLLEDWAAPRAEQPCVGDRVELGLSHPCTTFDKWRWMSLVEDDGRVSGAIQTCF